MFVVLKRKVIVWVLFGLVALQIALIFVACINQLSQKTSIIDFTIVIDAGHGGIDKGVVASDGTEESALNLAYAMELGEMFSASGFNVVYTRQKEGGLYGLPTKGFKMRDMQARKKIICDSMANLVISIHMNEYSSGLRKGPQVFYQVDNTQGQSLANSIQNSLNTYVQLNYKTLAGDYYICREIDCPSVIVECGFLSNADDLANLKLDSYRKGICNTIFNGVMMYLCG